mgnify:CR=1 FL=1
MKDKQFKNLIKEALTPDFLKEDFDPVNINSEDEDQIKMILDKTDWYDKDVRAALGVIEEFGPVSYETFTFDEMGFTEENYFDLLTLVLSDWQKEGKNYQDLLLKFSINEDRFGDIEYMFSGEDEKTPVLVDVWYSYHEEHGYGGVYKVKVHFDDKSVETFDRLKDAEAKYDLEGVEREETEFDVS